MNFILNHQSDQGGQQGFRSNNTFKSTIFGESQKSDQQHQRVNNTNKSTIFSDIPKQSEINHRTNLGHQKDLKTSELFGNERIEPLRKTKNHYDQPTYQNEQVTASQRKANEFNNGKEFQKSEYRPQTACGKWNDVQFQKSSNNIEQNLSSFQLKQNELTSSVLQLPSYQSNIEKYTPSNMAYNSDWKSTQIKKNYNVDNGLTAKQQKENELKSSIFLESEKNSKRSSIQSSRQLQQPRWK